MKFRQVISQVGKPASVREALVNRTSKWVAEHFGVSRRTAQRWKAGTQQPSGRADRRERVMQSADAETRRKVAAEAFRDARAVNVGKATMRYPGKARGRGDQTKRNIGIVQLDERGRDLMRQAAEALEAGDEQRAEELANQAVLSTGGRDYGPLRIDDYPPGFHLL